MANDFMSSIVDGLFGLTAGGLSFAGTAIENKKQRKWASAEAQKARDWAEQMSNTAHQREVEDLREAGLNPILSVTGGNGATTPTAATASGVSTGSPLSEGLSKAISVFNALKDGELKTATARKADAEAGKADAEARKADVEAKAIEDIDEGARGAWGKFLDLLPSGWRDIPHYFGMANNAGDVERHRNQLKDKKSFREALEQEKIRNTSDVEGDEISNGIPDSWQFVKDNHSEMEKLHGKKGDYYYFFETYRKPNGDYVRVRQRARCVY